MNDTKKSTKSEIANLIKRIEQGNLLSNENKRLLAKSSFMDILDVMFIEACTVKQQNLIIKKWDELKRN